MVTAPETPLFLAPEPASFEYPAQLLTDAGTGPFGLLYLHLEDRGDGPQLAILGHPEIERIHTLCKAVNFGPVPDENALRTWARFLTTCPDHQAPQDNCEVCEVVTPVTWWLDWKPVDAPEANAGKPGYFPITVLGA